MKNLSFAQYSDFEVSDQAQGLQSGLIAKRLLDVTVSGLALVALSPIFLLVAVCIKMESAGNVFFKQKRVGLNGEHFTMWKFRSMFQDAEARRKQLEAQNEMQEGVLFKMKNDPRITRVGAFIRKTLSMSCPNC